MAVTLVGYLALFAFAGVAFLFVNLLIGRLLRPQNPYDEKLEIYECGEPAIGSSFVQFDIRFYVVALLFIIFDVEVAFFFPWAIVFGKAAQLANDPRPMIQRVDQHWQWSPHAEGIMAELGVPSSALSLDLAPGGGEAKTRELESKSRQALRDLAWTACTDILMFFGVLMVGFLYVWRRGDLDWVRSVTRQAGPAPPAVAETPRAAHWEPQLTT
ncbi:MAG: hypothetical protein KatS3mg110_2833 [Pirellulaceae bacterium]|nr:MAG: hypothetical protein KatS3mg110_2833 [Pirellulaceae bacterium]